MALSTTKFSDENELSRPATEPMPVVFAGHGSPMNLVDKNRFNDALVRLGQSLPRPRGIVCVSAHWMTEKTSITRAAKPKQIFDFHGFPEELYRIHYTPEGWPKLARELSENFSNIIAVDDWGLDHGSWAVCHQMYPAQDVPVAQLSLSARLSPLEHLQVARQLRFLRQQGVLILGSGNLVHNLRRIDWKAEAPAHPWAVEFEEFVLSTVLSRQWSAEEKVERIWSSPQLALAHPSDEHLLPLIYVLGAATDEEVPVVEVRGIQNAAISMATLRFGA